MKNISDVLVLELTNVCDLNCVFCTTNKKIDSIGIELLEHIIKENSKLENPIKTFELGWNGNPFRYKKIRKILELFQYYNLNSNIVTNGLNLKDTLVFFEDELLKNVHFTIFFDSSNEEKNDKMMGAKKAFKKSLESLEYLKDRNLRYDILMRVNSLNYNEIEQILEIAKFYHCNLLVPMETFPFVNDRRLLLTDEMKSEVITKIDKLRSFGEPIHKTIQFEKPEGNCTYLRKKRLFVNSKGELAFCHFLSSLEKTKILEIKKKKLSKVTEINEKVRDEFVRRKKKELMKWKPPRNTASPCSYCLHYFGMDAKW
jgi:MoaA/NifB/PqqE/SkfB family radical SAM enzyme